MNVFSLYGDVDIRTNNATSRLNNLRSLAKNVGNSFKNIGTKVTAAGHAMTTFVSVPIAAALGYSIKQASDLNETVSKTKVVFKNSSDSVLKWSDNTLTSIGLAKGTALDMASVLGDMGTSMGLSTKESAKMSTSIVDLTGDMASFKNMKPEEIHTALTGIYTGETEALKSLGIVMTETNLKEYAKQQGIKKSISDMTQAEKVQLRYSYVMAMSKNSIGDFQNTQSSAANQMRIFTESIKEVAAQIGVILLPYFTAAVTKLNALVTWFRGLSPAIQGVVVKIALVVAVIGPLLIVLGTVITAIGAIITVISTVGIEVVAIVAGIAILITTITSLIVKIVGWQNIMTAISNLMSKIAPILTAVWGAIQNGNDPIQAAIMAFYEFIGGGEALKAALLSLLDRWIYFRDAVSEAIKTLIVVFTEIFSDIWNVVYPFFQRLVTEAYPVFLSLVSEIIGLLGDLFKMFNQRLKEILKVWKIVWKAIKPYVKENLNNVVTIVKAAFNILKNLVKAVRAAIRGDWSGLWKAVKSIVKTAASAALSIGRSLRNQFVSIMSNLVSRVKSKFNSLKGKILSALKGIPSALYTAGRNMLSMLVKGINSKLQAVKNAASNVASKIKSFLGFGSPTEEGPGKYSDSWMPNMMTMFKKGIISKIPAIKEALNVVGKTVESNQPVLTPGFATTGITSNKSTTGEKQVILNVNNAKIFDKSDIDKFMTPVVQRLKRAGFKGVS